METKPLTTAQRVAYAFQGCGNMLIIVLKNAYTMVFLTNCAGIETSKAALIVSVVYYINMVSVVFVGSLVEKTKSKAGKYRRAKICSRHLKPHYMVFRL